MCSLCYPAAQGHLGFVLRLFYTILLYLLAPVVLLRLAWRGIRSPAYLRRWKERFGFIEPALGERVIWLHAVSVGEVQAAEPLIRRLLEDYSDYSLLITTVTPTGSARVLELFGDEVAHVYAPYDLPGTVTRFLDRVQPHLAIVMETELWPNLFHACSHAGVPLLLVNARLSEKSLRRYRRVAGLVRQTLQQVTMIAAQTDADAERFRRLGAHADRVIVSGNLKFDQGLPADIRVRATAMRNDWGVDRPVWIAASTHEGEDELLLDVQRRLRKSLENPLLVIVPRHPERFERVADACRKHGLVTVLRSERRSCSDRVQVFVGDSMGELMLFYAAGDVAFVGGSLVPHGGHNMLEPAAMGLPVVSGPHVFNFALIAELLTAAGACEIVHGPAELAKVVGRWLQDPGARRVAGERGLQVVEQNRGALQKVMAMVGEQLGSTG